MSFSGTFDPARHPRLPKGQHGGGEFGAGSGAAGNSSSTPPSAPVHPKTPVAPTVATAPGVPKPRAVRTNAGQTGDDEQGGQSTLSHKLLRVAVGSADDVAVIALQGVVKRHPEWFQVVTALFKSADDLVNSAGDLAKFDASQPRDEDGRWTAGGAAVVAGAAAAGGAGGAGGASLGIRVGRKKALDAARAAAAPVRVAIWSVAKDLSARTARRQGAADNIEHALRYGAKTNFIPTAIRGLNSQARRGENALRHREAILGARDMRAALPGADLSSLFPDVDFGEAFPTPSPSGAAAPTDAGNVLAHADALRAQMKLKAQIDDLKANGKPARRVPVAGANRRAHVETFEKPRQVRRVRWDRERVAARIAARPDHFAKLGIRSVDDAEKFALRTPARAVMDAGLPRPQVYLDLVRDEVRNRPGAMPGHTRYIEGYPDARGRKRVADMIRPDVAARLEQARLRDRVSERATRPIAEARVIADRNGWQSALRRSMFLRTNRKAAVIGAGLLGAAAAGSAAYGWLNRKRVEKLAKAADASPESTPDPAQQVFDAGNDIEHLLAHKVAQTFGRWSRLPGALLQNPSAGLHAILERSFDTALAPLGDAARAGAQADVPVITQDASGRNRIVGLSLDTGSDKVRTFSQNYRVKLAGQIADEQMQTIQSVLRDATLQGQPPAVTARLLRQSIGLTPVQAGYVLSFRRALLALDPNALRRQLRDARYDRTVQKAITTGTPLTEAQVNAMVDAYQRRALALRAMTIARTEGVGAANNGHALAVQEFVDENPGYTVIKTWSATDDERTRPDHVAMDGQQVVGLYTPFVAPSGDRIMWPHDPNAPLRQRVNCRCTFGVALVPRTAVAHRGFSLLADSPLEDASEAM